MLHRTVWGATPASSDGQKTKSKLVTWLVMLCFIEVNGVCHLPVHIKFDSIVSLSTLRPTKLNKCFIPKQPKTNLVNCLDKFSSLFRQSISTGFLSWIMKTDYNTSPGTNTVWLKTLRQTIKKTVKPSALLIFVQFIKWFDKFMWYSQWRRWVFHHQSKQYNTGSIHNFTLTWAWGKRHIISTRSCLLPLF